MFRNSTYKQKIIGLVFFGLILFFAAKKRSYSKAIGIYNQVQDIEEKMKYIESSKTTIYDLKKEVAYYDSFIGSGATSPEVTQQKILSFSSGFNFVETIGINEIHKVNSNGFNIITNRLVMEGYYNDLLHVIYEFEKSFSDATISSITFTRNKGVKDISGKINTVITFQNYEKDKL